MKSKLQKETNKCKLWGNCSNLTPSSAQRNPLYPKKILQTTKIPRKATHPAYPRHPFLPALLVNLRLSLLPPVCRRTLILAPTSAQRNPLYPQEDPSDNQNPQESHPATQHFPDIHFTSSTGKITLAQ